MAHEARDKIWKILTFATTMKISPVDLTEISDECRDYLNHYNNS